MKQSAAKYISLAAFLLGTASTAAAQVPQHGSVPQANASVIFTQISPYNTSNPNANFEWSIMLMGFPAPFETQHVEFSAPNTAPITLDIMTDSACSQLAAAIFKCIVQYPLSTADMAGSSANINTRYYATKNGGADVRYHQYSGIVTGTAGTSGTTSGGGNPIPPVSPIPPHNTITADTFYNINVSSSQPNYSPTNNIIPINLVITPNSPPTSLSLPFANELVEIKSPNGAVKTLHIPSNCTRSGFNNMTLTCSTTYVLPASDAAQPNLTFEGRYFANDYYNNTQQVWTGYSRGTISLQGTPTGGFTGTNCPPENNPMMPTNVSTNVNGSVFTFTQNTNDVCGSTFWIDPPIAIGYSYHVSGGKFESVTLPGLQTVADGNGYTLHYSLGGYQSVAVMPGQQFSFPSPVSGYQIKGIDPSLGLNLHDPAAFAMGVKLTDPSGPQVRIRQTPMPLGTGVIIDRPVVLDRFERVRPGSAVGVATEVKPSVANPVKVAPEKVDTKRADPPTPNGSGFNNGANRTA